MSNQFVKVPESMIKHDPEDMGKRKIKQVDTDKLVYMTLKRKLHDDSMIVKIAIATLAQKCGLSPKTTQNALTRLEEIGAIEKIKGSKCNSYKINPFSEFFQMFDYEFVYNEELSAKHKTALMSIQPHLFVNDSVGTTTYSTTDLAKLTGYSRPSITKYLEEFEEMGILTKRTTVNEIGSNVTALDFNLPKIGQFILCKTIQNSEDIEVMKEQIKELMKDKAEKESLKKEVAYLKKIMKVDKEQIDEIIL